MYIEYMKNMLIGAVVVCVMVGCVVWACVAGARDAGPVKAVPLVVKVPDGDSMSIGVTQSPHVFNWYVGKFEERWGAAPCRAKPGDPIEPCMTRTLEWVLRVAK